MTYRTALRKLAHKYGATLSDRESGHYRLTLPDGRYVTCSRSPRCPFAIRKVEGDLRRLIPDA